MFPRPLPDEQHGVLDEQLGGVFSDMVPADGGFSTLDEDFAHLREDGLAGGSIVSDSSSEDESSQEEKSFLTYPELMQVSKASAASWKAVGDFCEWAKSMKFNDAYRVENLEKDFRAFHVDQVAEVASIAQLAAASKASIQYSVLLGCQHHAEAEVHVAKENGGHWL